MDKKEFIQKITHLIGYPDAAEMYDFIEVDESGDIENCFEFCYYLCELIKELYEYE